MVDAIEACKIIYLSFLEYLDRLVELELEFSARSWKSSLRGVVGGVGGVYGFYGCMITQSNPGRSVKIPICTILLGRRIYVLTSRQSRILNGLILSKYIPLTPWCNNTSLFVLSFNSKAGDQEIPVQHHQCADPVTGKVRRPFNLIADRASQRLRRIRRYPVAKLAILWEIKATVEEMGIK